MVCIQSAVASKEVRNADLKDTEQLPDELGCPDDAMHNLSVKEITPSQFMLFFFSPDPFTAARKMVHLLHFVQLTVQHFSTDSDRGNSGNSATNISC